METHVKVVGVLNIVSGALGLMAGLVLMVIFGGVTGLITAGGDADAMVAAPIVGLTGLTIVVLIVAVSLPSVIIGYGLYQLRPWSRLPGIVLSIISLLFVPLGTALGIYGLWVLFSKDGQRILEPQVTHA